jgi:hypothetical protein
MKTRTIRPAALKGSIAAATCPNLMALLTQAPVDVRRHYVDVRSTSATKLLARTEADRVPVTITDDTILDLEIAVAAAIMRCANLRLREIVALRYRGADADLIMPKRRNAVASLRLRPNKSRKWPTRIRLDEETTSILWAYLRNYRPIVAKQRGDADPRLLFPSGRRESDGSAGADNALRRVFWRRLRKATVLPRDPQPRYLRARLLLDIPLRRSADWLDSSRLVILGRAVTARTI